MRKLKLVLTGTGRCATGFYAKYLTSAGLTCGHERFFSYWGLEKAIRLLSHWVGTVADSSWLAAPFLDSEPLKDALVVHLVRHPKQTIESWLRVPSHTTPDWDRFRRLHLPTLINYAELIEQAAHTWIEWNRKIEKAIANRDSVLFKVEREPWGLLEELARHDFLNLDSIDRDSLFSDRQYNTKVGLPVAVYLDDIKDSGLRAELEEMSARYGYDWPERPLEITSLERVTKAIITSFDNLANLKETVPILKTDSLVGEIIVVNNGSRDGTAEWLGKQGVVAVNRKNLGAGPGRNAGLDAAGECDYFLMLDGGIRPLYGGTERMLNYLEQQQGADVIGIEIPDFETDYEKAWRRWPAPITKTYQNNRLSHTAYCLARFRAFDGLRFCEEGPFGQPGWGADDDEMAYQWIEAGVVVHVVTGVHPYRRASGSFRRLYKETGIWPNQYGSVYEQRVVWLQQNWPQHQPGLQWGEPWLTVVVKAGGIEPTAKMIKRAHDVLIKRKFEKPWDGYPNPYSVIAWANGNEVFLEWAEPRRLRQHTGTAIIINDEIVTRSKDSEDTWTGDFRLWTEDNWEAAVRPNAFYYSLVSTMEELDILLNKYNQLHPEQPSRLLTPPGRQEL